MGTSTWAQDLPTWALLLIVAGGIGLLLVLVIKAKLQPFLALLIVSLLVALGAGIPLAEVLPTIKSGLGATLGSIAIVVALGAMLSKVLEESGGARVLASRLVRWTGERRAPLAMGLTGFVFGIPVFFDVGLIILMPLVLGVAARVPALRGHTLAVALPTATALMAVHTMLPPHPGPVAVAAQLGADLGLVALWGAVIGFAAWIVAGYPIGVRIGRRIPLPIPAGHRIEPAHTDAPGADARPAPSFALVGGLIVLPILLILGNTLSAAVLPEGGTARTALSFVGDPAVALMITALLAFYFLGLRRGASMSRIETMATSAMSSAAVVILVTGAGGAFGAVLVASGVGDALSGVLGGLGVSLVVLGFIVSAALRLAQGSATVAMVTTAGIVGPVLLQQDVGASAAALVVVAVGAGAAAFSHVNDSGFWMVSRLLGMDVATSLRSWTVAVSAMGVAAFVITFLLSLVVR
ncbi:GntP family permease [Nocardiopsis sp. NPDC050513]|uniref:GntP family permease n=1 Tax=Nocardiopsis sp. NPDC050513 TaxID=3364338 RepID=UPI0037AF4A5A